jgi:hypothetical protein
MYKVEPLVRGTVIPAPKSVSPLIPPVKPSITREDAPGAVGTEGTTPTPQATAQAPINDSSAVKSDSGEGATSEVSKVSPATSEASDPRLAELARKEMLLREEARKVEAQKAELETLRKQATEPKGMTAEEWKAKFLEDPSSVGMTYDEMANRYLNQPTEEVQKLSALEAKIAQLESQLGQGNKAYEEAQAQAYTNAMKQLKAQTSQLVETAPQDFELISSQGAHDQVVKLIEDTYRAEGRLMSVKQAAEEVEKQLLDRALSFAALNKVKQKLVGDGKTSPSPAEDKAVPQKTLSQTITTGAKLTSAQIRERAIARARGQQ